MAGHKLTVGKVEIVALLDMPMALPFPMFFPKVEAKEWKPWKAHYPSAFSSDGRLQTNAQCYLLRSGERAILIDTGLGPGPIDLLGGARGHLLEDMASKGVGAEDVAVVAFTHLHGDHIGWNLTSDGKPTFPKAMYMIPQADWAFFTQPQVLEQNPGLPQTVLPLQGLGVMELFAGEVRLSDEVTTIPTPGHTPGHTSFLVASQGERAIITGDLAHHPAQVEHTDWVPAFDTDGARAIETRRKIFDRLEAESLLAAFCHFPTPGFGRLVRLQGRRMFQAL